MNKSSSNDKPLMTLSLFQKFMKDFGFFPALIKKQRLDEIFNAIAFSHKRPKDFKIDRKISEKMRLRNEEKVIDKHLLV